MGRLKQKGKAGAAKAYVTRSQAVKRLQCSLADFRRLCILKGIFPREPRNKKKANKGSSAPTSFYYAKDIAYLAHEPVLRKLREHKAFAKKLARALGRGEWSSAKSLEENKPVYRLDHIIKERYPTFVDAVRDIDDALCLVSLFASLPSSEKLPPSLIENCTRLSAEWQLYIIQTHSLRKVFLSIKGVYLQAEVMDQTVTWLVPYQFTQNIPVDVDVRVMLTFLELYQTMLGFVFFKLYSDVGLVYPPPLDVDKDASAGGVGAFKIQQTTSGPAVDENKNGSKPKKVQSKVIRQTIKDITMGSTENSAALEELPTVEEENGAVVDDEFVTQLSKSSVDESSSLTTLRTLSTLPETTATKLFSPYTFFISRESSRQLFEFIIRSFGGRVGWPATSGSGSPFEETDETITHVIIDRPLLSTTTESAKMREWRRKRKYVQPQWVVDCINAGKILSEEQYMQGQTLPPHLSPFGEDAGAYNPVHEGADAMEVEVSEEEDEEEEEEVQHSGSSDETDVLDAAVARAAEDPEQLHAAEVEAEARGMDLGEFEKKVNKAAKKVAKGPVAEPEKDDNKEMSKALLSNKQRKLYEKMKYSQNKRTAQREQLEQRKRQLLKEKRKGVKS